MLQRLPSPRHAAADQAVQVSIAARRCGLTPRAVRLYEERGLVTAARDAIGQRLYDVATLDRLRFVAEARAAGMTLKTISALLTIGDEQGREALDEAFAKACHDRLTQLEAQGLTIRRILSQGLAAAP